MGLSCLVVQVAVANAPLPGGGPAEGAVSVMIGKAGSVMVGEISATTSTIMTMLQYQYQLLVSAIKVNTQQTSKSGDKVAKAVGASYEGLSAAQVALQANQELGAAYLRYSAVTGQGHDPCGTLARARTTAMAFDAIPSRAAQLQQQLDQAPGRLAVSPIALERQRIERHHALFCSADEARSGICTEGRLPGGDTNAAMLFEAADPGSVQLEARQAVIQHLLGEVDGGLPRIRAASAEGDAYLAQKNRKDAYLSISAHSLARIHAANTRDAAWGHLSPNELLQARVRQYTGGVDAPSWAARMALQHQRGVLLELVKLQGMGAWLSSQQYQQNQRQELHLAALLLLRGQTALAADAGERAQGSMIE